jgi:hypothetical protein
MVVATEPTNPQTAANFDCNASARIIAKIEMATVLTVRTTARVHIRSFPLFSA